MKSFSFQVSDADFELLQTPQKSAYYISINLDLASGGLAIVKDGSSWLEWLFHSEFEGSHGARCGDHRVALDGLISTA
jgi:hypothetical protein